MPRTLPAALTTVMDAGIYEPYIRVVTASDPATTAETVQPLGYKLEPLRATVTIPMSAANDNSWFRIVRGAVINGTPSTISSIWFRTIDYKYNGKFVTLEGEPLAREYMSIAANSDYQTVIETALLRDVGQIVASYEGTAAWKAYQFYPAGKNIILSPIKNLFTMLQQKYLIFATEDGFDGTDDNMFFFVATATRSTDYTIIDQLFNFNAHTTTRKLISRDEANTVHTSGASTDVLHNLGFLHSTASQPTNNPVQQAGSRSSKLPVHLKYRTGDKVDITQDANINPQPMRIRVTEVLDLNSTPAWYQIIETLEWYGSTEGGPMPSTIEAAAPYTPLMTGNFNNVLSANDNNVQAAMETIDDHTHATPTPAQVGAIPNDGWIAGTGTWSYSSADAPIFVASVPDADAANMNIGDRWKLTQTSVKYFIVVAKGSPSGGSTPVTIYGGTDYTLANASITSPFYSHVKSPLGFPLDLTKWRVRVTNTSTNTQSNPTQNTWYNVGSISISIPIGKWRLRYFTVLYGDRAAAGLITVYVTLSTANNSQSDASLSSNFAASPITILGAPVEKALVLDMSSKTTYYLNHKTDTTNITTIGNQGSLFTTYIEVESAYL